jgi:S-adenosylmethionine-diacylglycerol 3-amino-3-carboxypropyl transferase
MHASLAVRPAAAAPSPTADEPVARRLTLDSALPARLFFAQVREDPQVELEALAPARHEALVVVSSGGCTALSLLAAGAAVTAVDVNPVQNHLVELKAAALAHLEPAAARAFLGARPAERAWRADTYARLRAGLGEGARAHWDAAPRAIAAGVLHAGLTEIVIAALARLVRATVHPPERVERLLACRSLEEQRSLYRREWNNRRWRLLFRLLLNRPALARALDPRFFGRARGLARQFHALWEHALTELPVGDNYFLHDLLRGAYPEHARPPYLDESGAACWRERLRALTLVDGTLTDHLRACPDRSVAGFALSNVCEWLDAAGQDALFAQVARCAAPGARVCLRNFVGHTDVPTAWRDVLIEEPGLGERLAARDRSLMQRRVVVFRVRAARGGVGARRARVRPARVVDDDALVGLAARCPMRGDVGLCVERAPSFFELARLEGGRWRVGVADAPEGVVGCITVAEREAYLGGRPARTFYVGDLKVAPERRDGRVADELCAWGARTLLEWGGPQAPVVLTILSGNRAMERRVPGLRGLPQLTPLRTLRVHALPFLRRLPRAEGGLTLRPAQEADLEAMAELWKRTARARDLAPVFDAAALHEWIARAPGLSLCDYLLAWRRDGRLAGFVGLWDQHGFKQLRVVAFSRRMALFRRAHNALAALAGATPLPAEGSLMRSLAAVHVCVPADSPQVLRALLLRALAERRAQGYAFLSLGLDRRDPLSAAVRGLLAQPTDVGVYVSSPAGRYAGPPFDGRPLHFETALA